eukprot:scpid92176/ scgid10661/ Ankyrin repeat domain-containing protein 13C
MASNGEPFKLHKAVFHNDIRSLKACLNARGVDVEERDCHSLTPLLLAAKLGRLDCAELLINSGAKVDAKSDDGWSVMDEAVVYGDRELVEFFVKAGYNQATTDLKELKPKLEEALKKVPDFTLVFQWELSSWIPLLSRVLPSDVCRLHKCGSHLRMDATLQSITDLRNRRGDLSFFIDCTDISHVIVADNIRHVKEVLKPQLSSKYVTESTSLRLSKDVVHSFISTQPIELIRCRSGWLWRVDKEECVAGYSCPVYDITGVTLIQRRRCEHLTEEDVKRLKSLREKMKRGDGDDVDDEDGDAAAAAAAAEGESGAESSDGSALEVPFRASRPAPVTTATWSDYVNSASGGLPDNVGRTPVVSQDRRQFKPTVALSDKFPIPRDLLLDILELFTPYKHFHKLRRLVSRLPPGFPMKVEVPLYPTITLKLAFQEFKTCSHPASMFTVPNYDTGHVFPQQRR